jgi:hypothetical protein
MLQYRTEMSINESIYANINPLKFKQYHYSMSSPPPQKKTISLRYIYIYIYIQGE